MNKARHSRRRRVGLGAAWMLLLSAGPLHGQQGTPSQPAAPPSVPATETPATNLPGVAVLPPRPTEAPVDGLTRKDADVIAWALAGGKTLELRDFAFSGQPVRSDKLHFKQIAPGVLEITSVAYAVGEWSFHVRDAGSYYGLGERADALNHAHTTVKNAMVTADAVGGGALGAASQKPMPFFMSTTGYGLWVDTTSEASFDLNASASDDITVTLAAQRLRIVLFPGPDFAGILERFTRTMGPALLPPYWAFAPWMALPAGATQAQATAVIEKLREVNLPASVLLLNDPWTAHGGFSFDAKLFDDAPELVKRLHDAGFKLTVGASPWIERPNPDPAGGFDSDPFFVKTEAGVPYVREGVKRSSAVDLTSGGSRAWWQGGLRDAMKVGVDGFVLEDAAGGFSTGVKFTDGTDTRAMRNRYTMLATGAAEELIDKDLKSDGVLLNRNASQGASGAGFLLAETHAASFNPESGLPTLVNAALNAGLSGQPLWTAEMGEGKADDAVFTRWAELACFSPVMVTTHEPWGFGEAAFEVYRKYSTLHMSLFPYRYAAAVEAAKTGMPVMRALVLAYQNDERARAARDEYMFGPDLLVAPVLDESTSRLVYLPAGVWVNYWTGVQVQGGRSLMVDAPLDTVPVYARMGAVIPKVLDDVQTLVTAKESGNASLRTLDGRRVYEVVGPSAETETGTMDFEGRKVTRSATTLTVSGGPAARVIVRWRFVPVNAVTVNGAAVNLQSGKEGPFVEFDYSNSATVAWQ